MFFCGIFLNTHGIYSISLQYFHILQISTSATVLMMCVCMVVVKIPQEITFVGVILDIRCLQTNTCVLVSIVEVRESFQLDMTV
jgi:hypothetical protein